MTIDEIKAISIKDYLGSMSIYPIKNYGYYGMYKSPFRNEHTPSFQVSKLIIIKIYGMTLHLMKVGVL